MSRDIRSRVPWTLSNAGAVTLTIGVLAASPLLAQSIPAKTVPEPAGQPMPLPSSNPGMAGLSVVIDDPLRDPFVNPALGALGPALQLSMTPHLYEDHGETLEGVSVPVVATINTGGWFGGFVAGVQDARVAPNAFLSVPTQLREEVENRPGKNRYLAGSIGRVFWSRATIGVSAKEADLELVEDVRRAYPEALSVRQHGTHRELRLGSLLDLGPGRHLDFVVGRAEREMTHRVHSWDMVPDPDPDRFGSVIPVDRTEEHLQRTRTDHARIRYRHGFPEFLTRVGILAAVYSREQLDAPAFDLVNIPRDPGSSTLYEFGLGVEASDGVSSFHAEVAYVPGSARTRTLTSEGTDGSFGERETLAEHDFRFKNWRFDAGAEIVQGRATFQLGAGAREHRYQLEQFYPMTGQDREGRKSWREWSTSAAAHLRLGPVEVGYMGRVQARGLAPCPPHSFRPKCLGRIETFQGTGRTVAPTHPEFLPDFRVLTHGPSLRVVLGR